MHEYIVGLEIFMAASRNIRGYIAQGGDGAYAPAAKGRERAYMAQARGKEPALD
jgi:hypothetical protein